MRNLRQMKTSFACFPCRCLTKRNFDCSCELTGSEKRNLEQQLYNSSSDPLTKSLEELTYPYRYTRSHYAIFYLASNRPCACGYCHRGKPELRFLLQIQN